ncbi:MAG: response regulator [Zoogloea sp.]|uniref:response regulator n=1 Tax=Zoogloea sp. TaxID=49181 RepID=UPI0026234B98|nr:response regulator [Zoogloea sp.]MDD3327829.1 response regulator [Zoogloea sp.]
MTSPLPPRVLIVDDDPDLRDLLSEYLAANGLQIESAGDGTTMRQAMARQAPDAVVLDLMLPGEDGLSLARELRAHSGVGILMLSARGEEMDRVIGLEVGADDYMAKPFSPRELLARLRALLRRTRAAAPAEQPAAIPGKHCFGHFALDISAHRLLRDNHEVRITTAEFELLRVFVERPNRVLSRDDIIDLLKGYDRDPFDRSVDIRVTRLRRRIEADPSKPEYIRTVRGEGYLFNPLGAQVRR